MPDDVQKVLASLKGMKPERVTVFISGYVVWYNMQNQNLNRRNVLKILKLKTFKNFSIGIRDNKTMLSIIFEDKL